MTGKDKAGALEISKQCCVLSARDRFGSVQRRADGWIQICVRDSAIRLVEADYWTLMESLSQSARALASASADAASIST